MLDTTVTQPAYDRSAEPAIVHLGVGAFHRAHQAVYNDTVLAQVPNSRSWMTTGVCLKTPGTRNRLAPQDNLFTLRVRDGETDSMQIIGSIGRVLFAGDEPLRVMSALTAKTTRIVTLTITEKGYCRDPASGDLDVGAADIRFDLSAPDSPRSAIGWLAMALSKRRDSGHQGFAILSCDNLPHNGEAVRRVLLAFCDRLDPDLRQWVEDEVTFPSTMVDRIVPAVTGDVLADVSARLGLRDEAAVVTEPFTQWVIEDNFRHGRPEWEQAGAVLTADVTPFEIMKLRLLNGAHSAIAYLGHLAGHTFVSDCIADPLFRGFIETMMRTEIGPTVEPPPDFSLENYIDALLQRFANPRLLHRCLQIAVDGSQKLPQRQLVTIRDRLARGQSIECLSMAVASWMVFVTGRDLAGRTHTVDDPLASLLEKNAAHLVHEPEALVTGLLSVHQVFGDLAVSIPLRRSLTHHVRSLYEIGVGASLKMLAGAA